MRGDGAVYSKIFVTELVLVARHTATLVPLKITSTPENSYENQTHNYIFHEFSNERGTILKLPIAALVPSTGYRPWSLDQCM